MGGKRLSVCRHCGGKFHADTYNRHHQQWCAKPDCRRARDRARKRNYYRRRLEREAGFRQAERERCRAAMQRCRSRRNSANDQPATLGLPSPPAADLLVGLIAHLVDTTDPHRVAQVMGCYAERGRQLAIMPRVRGAP